MLNWLDTTTVVVVLYACAGATAITLGLVERHRASTADQNVWPSFWFATGVLLFVMAAGRAGNVSDLLTDIGREQARSGGWYEVRRSFQVWVIGAVATGWVVAVAVAVWRVPERRRRYLPTAVAVFTLICYVGVRLISLHQVDALLHNREVRGVTVGAVVETGLLLVVIVVSAWRFPGPSRALPDERNEPHVERQAAPRFRD